MSKPHSKTSDKLLKNIEIVRLAKKRELDQALNIKEFAVLAGVSYSKASFWFRQPGFPSLGRVVFWADFVIWRQSHAGLTTFVEKIKQDAVKPSFDSEEPSHTQPSIRRRHIQYSPRVLEILRGAGVDV